MGSINWSAAPVEMEAAYRTYVGRRNAEAELFKGQPKPTQVDLERANLVIPSADKECIFIIYHTTMDAQAAGKKQEGVSTTGKGGVIRVRLGRPFSELKALWGGFRLARAACREFKGLGDAREPGNSSFLTSRNNKVPWLAKGTSISWKFARTPEQEDHTSRTAYQSFNFDYRIKRRPTTRCLILWHVPLSSSRLGCAGVRNLVTLTHRGEQQSAWQTVACCPFYIIHHLREGNHSRKCTNLR